MKPVPPAPLDSGQRKKMLNELESLSGMLDGEEEKPRFDDLPVLKSFVEDVPVLSDRIGPAADTSFIDNDPLAISDAVRRQRQSQDAPATPAAAPVQPRHTKTDYERFREQHFEDPAITAKASEKSREPRETRGDAAEELRKLLGSGTGGAKPRFDTDPNSREYLQLRNKASQAVNEIIKAWMPRLEAELRMKLETEVDRIFKENR